MLFCLITMLDRFAPESHRFITQDWIKPKELRLIAQQEICRYHSVINGEREVTAVIQNQQLF
jgi:hypothetical protein